MLKNTKKIEPYSVLAEVYDDVMANVDYTLWADFIDEIIQRHHPEADLLLELACGTGSLTFELEKHGYRMAGADKSPAMIEKARIKAVDLKSNARFSKSDFLDIQLNNKFDAIVSIFDSVNYLLFEDELLELFTQVKKVMKKEALFIFDFTTPLNSFKSIDFLNEQKGSTPNGYHYFRKSWYDEEQRIHYNTFDIEELAADNQTVLRRFNEKHKQRAYTLAQMLEVIKQTDLTVQAKYGEFEMRRANKKSKRVTMVLKKGNQ